MPIGLIVPGVLWLDIVAKLGGLVVLGIGLWALGIVRPKNLAEIRRFVRTRGVPSVSA
jgi:hypothetical protein